MREKEGEAEREGEMGEREVEAERGGGRDGREKEREKQTDIIIAKQTEGVCVWGGGGSCSGGLVFSLFNLKVSKKSERQICLLKSYLQKKKKATQRVDRQATTYTPQKARLRNLRNRKVKDAF